MAARVAIHTGWKSLYGLAILVAAVCILVGCAKPIRSWCHEVIADGTHGCGEACIEESACDDCMNPVGCVTGTATQYVCTIPQCIFGQVLAVCHVPHKHLCTCDECGRSHCQGHIEPPRPPRFHPVPTNPVFPSEVVPVAPQSMGPNWAFDKASR